MKKNKFAFLSVTLALAITSLVGCGGNKPKESSQPETPSSSIEQVTSEQGGESSIAQPSSEHTNSSSQGGGQESSSTPKPSSSSQAPSSSSQKPSSSSQEPSSSAQQSSSSQATSSSEAPSSSSQQEVQKYTVTWKNYDGSILEIDYNVPYGATPSYDYETPVKPSDDAYDYVFKGWTPAITIVTSNQTYTATFDAVEKHVHNFVKNEDTLEYVCSCGEKNGRDYELYIELPELHAGDLYVSRDYNYSFKNDDGALVFGVVIYVIGDEIINPNKGTEYYIPNSLAGQNVYAELYIGVHDETNIKYSDDGRNVNNLDVYINNQLAQKASYMGISSGSGWVPMNAPSVINRKFFSYLFDLGTLLRNEQFSLWPTEELADVLEVWEVSDTVPSFEDCVEYDITYLDHEVDQGYFSIYVEGAGSEFIEEMHDRLTNEEWDGSTNMEASSGSWVSPNEELEIQAWIYGTRVNVSVHHLFKQTSPWPFEEIENMIVLEWGLDETIPYLDEPDYNYSFEGGSEDFFIRVEDGADLLDEYEEALDYVGYTKIGEAWYPDSQAIYIEVYADGSDLLIHVGLPDQPMLIEWPSEKIQTYYLDEWGVRKDIVPAFESEMIDHFEFYDDESDYFCVTVYPKEGYDADDLYGAYSDLLRDYGYSFDDYNQWFVSDDKEIYFDIFVNDIDEPQYIEICVGYIEVEMVGVYLEVEYNTNFGERIYLVGDFCDWGFDGAIAFEYDEDLGMWYAEFEVPAGTEYDCKLVVAAYDNPTEVIKWEEGSNRNYVFDSDYSETLYWQV